MSSWNDKLDELLVSLERERDELRLQVHLASRDAKDEFEVLESRLGSLRERVTSAGADAKGTASEVGDVMSDTARKMADDLRAGYRKIREKLSE